MNHPLRSVCVLVAVIGLASAWSPSARCDDTRGWYLSGGAGLNHIDTMKGATELDMGFRLAAAGGFQFNRVFALELDSGVLYNNFSRSNDPVARSHPITQFPLVVTGDFSLPNRSPFEPHLGAGTGVVLVQRAGTFGGDICLAAKGGVRYALNERLDLGADYTYFMYGAISAILGEPLGNDTFNLRLRWMY